MNYTYAVDSNGDVFKSVMIVPKTATEKYKELLRFSKNIQLEFPDLGSDGICCLIGRENKDRLVFFTRENLPATSDIVKQAYASKHESNYKYSSDMQKALYESVCDTEEKFKTLWWTLKAEIIEFERNLCDNEVISINRLSSQYYYTFCEELKKESDKWRLFCSDGFNPFDKAAVIKESITADMSIGVIIEQSLPELHTDPNSNKAMNALSEIIDNKCKKHLYSIYDDLKRFIKREIPNAYLPYYNGNVIGFKVNDKQYNIYVCGEENTHFIINGQDYENADELKKGLLSKEAFKENKWFEDKVKPHVITDINRKRKTKPKFHDNDFTL